MARRGGFKTQAPRETTVIVASILSIAGFAGVILGAVSLSGNYGEWALVISGLLLIIGSPAGSI